MKFHPSPRIRSRNIERKPFCNSVENLMKNAVIIPSKTVANTT